MLNWLSANWGNILVVCVLALAVGAIFFCRVRAAKKGKRTCAQGCAGCALQGICHGSEDKK